VLCNALKSQKRKTPERDGGREKEGRERKRESRAYSEVLLRTRVREGGGAVSNASVPRGTCNWNWM